MGALSTGNALPPPSGIKVNFDPNPFQAPPAAKPITPGKIEQRINDGAMATLHLLNRGLHYTGGLIGGFSGSLVGVGDITATGVEGLVKGVGLLGLKLGIPENGSLRSVVEWADGRGNKALEDAGQVLDVIQQRGTQLPADAINAVASEIGAVGKLYQSGDPSKQAEGAYRIGTLLYNTLMTVADLRGTAKSAVQLGNELKSSVALTRN